jgi:hypothetical protein
MVKEEGQFHTKRISEVFENGAQIFKDIHESFLALESLITEQRTVDNLHAAAQVQTNEKRNQDKQRVRFNAYGADQESNPESLGALIRPKSDNVSRSLRQTIRQIWL